MADRSATARGFPPGSRPAPRRATAGTAGSSPLAAGRSVCGSGQKSVRILVGVEAPGWQGARREQTGSIRPTSNAARIRLGRHGAESDEGGQRLRGCAGDDGEATAADVYRLFMVPGMFHLPRRARHGPLRYADAARELGRGRHRSGPDSGGSCGQRRSDPQPPPGVRIRRSRRTPARAASTTRAISSAPFPDASAPSQHRYRVDFRRAPRRDEHRRTPHREQHCDHRDRRHRVGRVHAEEEP